MKYKNKKEIKELEKKIDTILIDFGNNYLEATQGKKLKTAQFRKKVINLISTEELYTELNSILDFQNFIKEVFLEDLLVVVEDTIKDLQKEIQKKLKDV